MTTAVRPGGSRRKGAPEAGAFDALDADGTWNEIVAWFERQREWGEIEALLDQAG